MAEATPDTSRLRELAKAATPGPWTDMPHGKLDGLVTYGSPPRSLTAGGRYHDPEFLGAGKFLEQADATFVANLNPAVVLSLLDRIEELERRGVFDAERAQTWNAAVGLRGAIRVALDEWHNIADHSEAAHAVHDILSNAYQDTAGKIA